MKNLVAVLAAVAMGVSAAVLPAGPVRADGPVAATPSGTTLQVVIGVPRGSGPSDRTRPIVVSLRCDLVGNEHPYPVEACAEVEAVKGDIDAIPPTGAGCTDVWQPVRISVSGTVADQPVRWSEEVSNEGCAVIAHGHVFRLPLDKTVSPAG
ncbi:SSI family serine proteinase inhibitor [Plantactinospora sp. CA-290183]|uniref:SSI family serine proteinase inhibitor n=1 Tax=Plantactinospora sp. CA-290183 TaxID=3240006 RepID=UPI003D910E58